MFIIKPETETRFHIETFLLTVVCFDGYLWRRLDVAFLALNLFFHLQITGVCYNITSPVTGKSTDLAFKFG